MESTITLRDRISLLSIKISANNEGKPTKTKEDMGKFWANVTPVVGKKSGKINFTKRAHCNEFINFYRVVIRQRPKWKNEERAKINALRWRDKELKVLDTFAEAGETGEFLEALCFENGEK